MVGSRRSIDRASTGRKASACMSPARGRWEVGASGSTVLALLQASAIVQAGPSCCSHSRSAASGSGCAIGAQRKLARARTSASSERGTLPSPIRSRAATAGLAARSSRKSSIQTTSPLLEPIFLPAEVTSP
ncbi:MAG TPA: hypothetical protein VNC16_10765 [Solirubrobacterales bacterium]|nr:hypothetical protein [Solirubrobacterales bacterium]